LGRGKGEGKERPKGRRERKRREERRRGQMKGGGKERKEGNGNGGKGGILCFFFRKNPAIRYLLSSESNAVTRPHINGIRSSLFATIQSRSHFSVA